LDLFSWDDPNQKISFSVTLVLVAGTTYAFAGYIIWFIQDPKRRHNWKLMREDMILSRADRVKLLEDLLKQKFELVELGRFEPPASYDSDD
jgi:hypothetical protein